VLGLYDLARRLQLPSALSDIGMPESGIERAADIVQNPYANPRPVDRASVRDLIARAYRGDPPLLQ
jgi:maleylacetate reductase